MCIEVGIEGNPSEPIVVACNKVREAIEESSRKSYTYNGRLNESSTVLAAAIVGRNTDPADIAETMMHNV